MIICFSGTDGAGKSTQIDALRQRLASVDIRTEYVWARGGYTPVFVALKRLLHLLMGRRSNETARSSSNAAYSARRSVALSKPWIARLWLILAMLDLLMLYAVYVRCLSMRGRWVILDRYLIDTRIDFLRNHAYVFSEKSLLWRLVCWTAPKPHVHFLLTVPVAVSEARSRQKNEPYPDSTETLVFRLAAYEEFARDRGGAIVHLDGRESVEELFRQIDRHIPALTMVRS